MIAVYTVITENYDNLRQIPAGALAEGVRYVCFSDRPRQVFPWEVLPFPQLGGNSHRMSRIPKMLPHLLLPEAEISIYMDGAFSLHSPPKQVVAELLGDADIALFRHPSHGSFHEERDFYQRQHGFIPADVEAEYQRMCAMNVPVNGDFWAGGFLLRKNNERVNGFNEMWMREFMRGSSNDQFSLYHALETAKKFELKVRTLPGYYDAGGRLAYNFHANAGDQGNRVYEQDNSAWSARVNRIKDLIADV
ncbi:MAG TPA: glycosyltransferase domain-containing protein [Candidatus Binatus sp.]|nr:glycosyltransferase domain-containing protein [Candidatus Binatus sp.]